MQGAQLWRDCWLGNRGPTDRAALELSPQPDLRDGVGPCGQIPPGEGRNLVSEADAAESHSALPMPQGGVACSRGQACPSAVPAVGGRLRGGGQRPRGSSQQARCPARRMAEHTPRSRYTPLESPEENQKFRREELDAGSHGYTMASLDDPCPLLFNFYFIFMLEYS